MCTSLQNQSASVRRSVSPLRSSLSNPGEKSDGRNVDLIEDETESRIVDDSELASCDFSTSDTDITPRKKVIRDAINFVESKMALLCSDSSDHNSDFVLLQTIAGIRIQPSVGEGQL